MSVKSILCIDDSLTIRKLVELSFKGTPVTLHFASTGKDGIQKAVDLNPDLILLDYVLPDMKGIDVCHRLAEKSATAAMPVMVMSAKTEGMYDIFQEIPQVIDFLGKPFKPADLVDRISKISTQGRSVKPGSAVPSAFTKEEREHLAKALYAQLRDRFAMIPQWLAEPGAQPSAKFFAQRILTGTVMDAVLDAVGQTLKPQAARGGLDPSASLTEDTMLAGRIGTLSLHDVLVMLNGTQRTGELQMTSGPQSVSVYFRGGQAVFVCTKSPIEYGANATVDLSRVDGALRARAEAEQATTGKPFFLGLAEAGVLPPCDLSHLLHVHGKRALLAALDATSGTFVFREGSAMPMFVEAYGHPIHLAQLTLERMRRTATVGSPLAETVVVSRTPAFGRKLAQFELSPPERRVAQVVDGRMTLAQLAQKVGLESTEFHGALARLLAVGLVESKDSGLSRSSSVLKRSVLIVEPDVEGFQAPLATLLKNRADPFALIAANDERDLFAAVRREKPCLAVINATYARAAALRVARAVRATPEFASVPLVAVLELETENDVQELTEAGFDSVLPKPVSFLDLQRFMLQ